jgi:hypothetical protein
MSKHADQAGRCHYLKYDNAPYYVKPTLFSRYGPQAWYFGMMGLPVPGDQEDKYHASGYVIKEVGPDGWAKKGVEYVERQAEELKARRSGGCLM